MRLDRVQLPQGAEERAWQVVRAAFAERRPIPPRRRLVRPAIAVALVAVVAGVAASPPGRAVLGSLREAVGVKKAAPALFSLPAQGRLLVLSQRGPWVVQPDGSKRLLGRYRDASWSPFGRFLAVTRRNELLAVDSQGKVRWAIARPDVRFPRWTGSRTDTRIAYLSGRTLRVITGDGAEDWALGRADPRVAPAWRPGTYDVAYVAPDGSLRVAAAGARRVLWSARPGPDGLRALAWSGDGRLLLALGHESVRVYRADGRLLDGAPTLGPSTAAVFAPRTHRFALLVGANALLVTRGAFCCPHHPLFTGTPALTGLAWSPDARWLLLEWPAANQWIFVRPGRRPRIAAVSNIAEQFGSFPRLAGWCCAR